MTDAGQVTPTLPSQDQQQQQQYQQQQQLRAPDQHDHAQELHSASGSALDTFSHRAYLGQGQSLQQQQSSGHQEVTFHQQHHQHHHHHHHQPAHDRQLVEDITRAFLLQEMTSDPTGVRQGSQSMLLQQHAPSSILPAEADDELNIYDYIYAKQEDDDEPEDHVVSASSLSSTAIQDLSSSHHISPVLSASSSIAVVSPSPPSSVTASSSSSASSSSVSQYDHATADTMSKDIASNSTLDISRVKTKDDDDNDIGSNVLFGPVNYMDSAMEIYEPSQVVSLPNQDLYRLLLDELQSTTQREKYFSTTEAPNASMTFLYHGQQTQTQTPTNPNMQMMGETAASPSVFSTKPEPLLAVKSEFEQEMGTSDPGPAVLSSLSAGLTTSSSYSSAMEDVFMETADPEDSPMSPGHSFSSPSSSGSVTPELTSPLLLPTEAISLPPSLRPEHTKAALKITMPKLSKSANSASKPTSRSASISPITQLNIQSAIEQHNARHKAAGAKRNNSQSHPESGTQPGGRAKKRKLSRQPTSVSPGLSPILTALPSPPASVRTTPPMHPSVMDISSALEKIDLPAPSIPVKGAAMTVEPSSPVSPTSPTSTKDALNRAGSSAEEDDVIMESAAESANSRPVKKKNANAKNKRPWTTEEEKLLLKMVDDQMPIKDIAETLDRSVHSVRSRRQVLTDPGFVKGNGHAQPRRSKPDPSSKLPTYSQMAFLSLARLPELQGTLNDVASMVEKLFSRYLNRIPRTGHKNLQIWRAQISDALAHEKGHPRPRFESFGIKRGRQWVYRLTVFGKGVMDAMGGVDEICEDLLKNNETLAGGVDGEGTAAGGAGAGLGQGNGYGYSYCPDAFTTKSSSKDSDSSIDLDVVKKEVVEDTSPEALAASAAIANAMAAMAAGMVAMTAAEDEKTAAALCSMSVLKTGLSNVKGKEGHVTTASGSRGRRSRA
ncbi:hypothetical protein BGZ96_012672 [Linnemannia gamsii]|uniref:Myb-like domain-containing protein n=1 Tax=Linnemannia gamsii TaxID=64522 RepID=A0ABQ7JPY7_9FUNG|nr:hypothetical protein BGZ96_012672 [Linnemannia gamsii]